MLSLSCSLCACLDPSDFKRAQRQEVDEEEELLSVLPTEEEKYAACDKFVFRFPQTSNEIFRKRPKRSSSVAEFSPKM